MEREIQSWPVGEPVPLERLNAAAAACLRELVADPAQLAQAVDDLSWGHATPMPDQARTVLSRVMLAPHPAGAVVVRRLVAESRP